ncbi:MAG: T9SS type A sorting domain-containing protein [Flavobacteriales bacterium]|nr:T9SS type A sorting domain-containing protein [Flavobacteriales bacterium]
MCRNLSIAFLLLSIWCSGQRLVPFGGSHNGYVEDLAVFNDQLIVVGLFNVLNDASVYGVASIDTNGTVSQIGPFTNSAVWIHDMTNYGSGLALAFRDPNSRGVAMWDGTTWTQLGANFDIAPKRVINFNGDLIAAGAFTTCGGIPTEKVARWTGSNWVQLGTTLDGTVQALAVHDGTLFSGGTFTGSNGIPLHHLAQLNGTSWVPVGSGLNAPVEDLRSVGSELWSVGAFTFDADSTIQLANSARWDGTQLAPLSVSPLAGDDRRILYANTLGYVLSDERQSILDPGPDERPMNMRGLRASVEFGAQIIAGGQFTHFAHREMTTLGKIVPGLDAHVLRVAGMNIRVNSLGGIGYDYDQGIPAFEVPAGSGRSSLYAQGLCAIAVRDTDMYVIPNRWQSQFAYGPVPGPWADDTTEGFWQRYAQVWPIDNGAVWDHIAQWGQPGYVPLPSIADWPGNGDLANGEPMDLAPYADHNADGAYDAITGDAPRFKGDAAIYQISSDQRSSGWFGLPEMGLDIHSMTYGYDAGPNDPLHQVLFQHYTVINRSSNTYDTLWLASWLDMDIGHSLDDLGGSDVGLGMLYTFNGDAFDEDMVEVLGYGVHPPAQGVLPLNATASSLMHFLPGGLPQQPDWPIEYYHTVHGKTWNGAAVIDPFTALPTPFMYPGDVYNPNEWSAVSANIPLSDVRSMASYGPWYNIAPGDTVCLDLAFVFAQDTLGDNLSSVTLLKQRAAAVKAWYDQQPLGCGEYIALEVPDQESSAQTPLLFPNPTADRLTVRNIPDGVGEIQVVDMLGRAVLRVPMARGRSEMQLDLTRVASGSYLIAFGGSTKAPAQRVSVVR